MIKPDKQEGMTNNFELENYCKFFGLKLVGVFSIDTLPNTLVDGFYICNTALSYQNGEHWLCFGIENNKTKCWYFDSLCLDMPDEIYRLLHNPTRPIHYNKFKIQSDTSQYCGWICVIIGYYMNHLKSISSIQKRMENIINIFHIKPEDNDKIIVELVQRAINMREREVKKNNG